MQRFILIENPNTPNNQFDNIEKTYTVIPVGYVARVLDNMQQVVQPCQI